jgi:hypothetical protein
LSSLLLLNEVAGELSNILMILAAAQALMAASEMASEELTLSAAGQVSFSLPPYGVAVLKSCSS